MIRNNGTESKKWIIYDYVQFIGSFISGFSKIYKISMTNVLCLVFIPKGISPPQYAMHTDSHKNLTLNSYTCFPAVKGKVKP